MLNIGRIHTNTKEYFSILRFLRIIHIKIGIHINTIVDVIVNTSYVLVIALNVMYFIA
jgi:hypothetical protein